VLRDVTVAGVDGIVLNGDMATGPMPAETLDRLAGLGERAIWVRGNADRELVAACEGQLSPDLPEVAPAPTAYGATQLAAHHRDLLADLPLSVTLEVTGMGPVLFCHATARSDTEIVLVDSPVERYREAFASTTLRHTSYDTHAAAAAFRAGAPGYPGLDEFIAENMIATPSDATALAAFTP
jgi:hypothetical protein